MFTHAFRRTVNVIKSSDLATTVTAIGSYVGYEYASHRVKQKYDLEAKLKKLFFFKQAPTPPTSVDSSSQRLEGSDAKTAATPSSHLSRRR